MTDDNAVKSDAVFFVLIFSAEFTLLEELIIETLKKAEDGMSDVQLANSLAFLTESDVAYLIGDGPLADVVEGDDSYRELMPGFSGKLFRVVDEAGEDADVGDGVCSEKYLEFFDRELTQLHGSAIPKKIKDAKARKYYRWNTSLSFLEDKLEDLAGEEDL